MTLEHRSAVSVKRGFRIAASVWKIFLLAYISPSLSISSQPHLSGPGSAQGTRHNDSSNRFQHSRARVVPAYRVLGAAEIAFRLDRSLPAEPDHRSAVRADIVQCRVEISISSLNERGSAITTEGVERC